MPQRSPYKLDHVTLHPLTLAFSDMALEQALSQASAQRTRYQGTTAMLVGIFVYVLAAILDHKLVPPAHAADVWLIRLTALCMPVFVLALTFTRHFKSLCHPLLAAVGLAAGMGVIGIQCLLPIENSAYYYPMMVLATFYTYNFVGTRFVYALGVDSVMFVTYNALFGVMMEYPPDILISHDFFIVSANLIGGSAGYISERQRRMLFLREQELEEANAMLCDMSERDALTGIPNRRKFDIVWSAKLQRAARQPLPLGVLLIDIDHFKGYNDYYGHQCGDNCLKQVAQALQATVLRTNDLVARIGGEEFVAVLPGLDGSDAALLAEKMRQAVEARKIPHAENSAAPVVTISIGVAAGIPESPAQLSVLLKVADAMLYQAKQSGRNRVMVA
ncbi:diguanylate cyclase [Cupriavidus pauculus]|uniref:GGDEF domain-containing protein n=1 Tax=Cupriavidus pauculus TaxID=82633 RepID=UPI001EE17CC0|nr:diguanylate cyclase [Cupriavidus pauculus]GJG96745.1 GGDEF domain-containing protein [Cupriavidus pauculus]